MAGVLGEPQVSTGDGARRNDFLGAERAAAHVIDRIVDLGGQLLYEKYIERKSYPFAAETISEVLVAHLRMCFVNHDLGDEGDDEGWTIEDEVERSELDTWAGYVVPVISRARSPAPSPKEPGRRKRGSPRKKPVDGKENKLPAPTARKLPPPKRDVDEYEDMLREYKIREEKRKRDAEEERRRRELDEAEKAAKLEKFREELAKKQITYDSQGQVLFVQPPNVNKLPPGVVSTGWREKMEIIKAEPKKGAKARSTARRGKAKARRPKDDKDQFTDTFSRLTHSQPSAFEVMQLAEGVDLAQTYPAKRSKKGPTPDVGGKMTRAGYRSLVEEGQQSAWQPSMNDSIDEEATLSSGQLDPQDDFNQQILKTDPSSWGRNPPLDPEQRETAESAPATVHDWKFKREAVGNLERMPRDRVAELGSTSGWRLPQPPLGATMGHGILKKTLSGREELHYFPQGEAAWSGQMTGGKSAGLGKTCSLPELPRPASYGKSDGMMSTSSSFLPHVDPSVLDLNRARREGGGVIQSSKQDILKSILRR